MKKNHWKIVFFILSIFCGVNLFLYSNEIIISIRDAITIWGQNIIPSLYPFFILSEILSYLDVFSVLNKFLSPIMKCFFHLSKNSSYALILSLFSGFPGGSKYTTDLINQNKINIKEANYLVTITHFANPLFVIGTIGNILLKNTKISIIILLSHILSGFILALLTRPKEVLNTYLPIQKNNNISFMDTLATSILKTFETLVLILGILIIFIVLTTILDHYLMFSNNINIVLSGLLEMTSGIHKISNSLLTIKEKAVLITAILSFGGFSVHMQVASFLTKYNLSYKNFFFARIKHVILSTILILILFSFL